MDWLNGRIFKELTTLPLPVAQECIKSLKFIFYTSPYSIACSIGSNKSLKLQDFISAKKLVNVVLLMIFNNSRLNQGAPEKQENQHI